MMEVLFLHLVAVAQEFALLHKPAMMIKHFVLQLQPEQPII